MESSLQQADLANKPLIQKFILNEFKRNCRIAGVLQNTSVRIHHQTNILKIPHLNQENVEFDALANIVRVDYDEFPADNSSATSITRDLKKEYTPDQLRKFPHDFTFALITEDTDKRFDEVFPRLEDGFDDKTPDLFIHDPESLLLLEFTTTRVGREDVLRRKYDEKSFKYREALSRRITRVRLNDTEMKFGFSPIALSDTAVAYSTDLMLPNVLINELCARYRFAINLVNLAELSGLKLGDSETDQMKIDVFSIIKSIEPKFQREGDSSDIKIKMTEERVITDNVGPSEARRESARVYKKLLTEGLSEVNRGIERVDVASIWLSISQSNIGTRSDNKSVLQLPGRLPNYNNGELWKPEQSFDVDSYPALWDKAIDGLNSEEWWFEYTLKELEERAMVDGTNYDEKEENKARRKYKRVKIPLNNEQQIEFAKVGVQGKQHKNNPEVQSYREQKSESFSVNTNVGDIEDYINGQESYKKVPPNISLRNVLMLLDSSLRMHGPVKDEDTQFLDVVTADSTFLWCQFISDIGSELCVSLKQNVGHDEFVLKKLRYWDAYLLIKPTNSDSHIFYSVLIRKEGSLDIMPNGICKSFIELSDYYIYPWMSYSISKLVNCVKVEAFYMAMVAQWSRYYEKRSVQGILDYNVRRMIKLCLLVHLEDKPKTEELLTLFRYISMEKFSLVKTNSTKMLEKIPSVLRSRLQVWVLAKLVNAMVSPNYEPTVAEDELSQGTKLDRLWLNMINPYTGETLSRPNKLVELYYIGYATNKDAKAWENTEFDLVKKIVKYEMELKKARPEYCGLVEPPDGNFRFHEWSRLLVCAGADALKRQLISMYSNRYIERIDSKIVDRLARLTWEQVATLKASSTFDPSKDKEIGKDGKYQTRRVKVVIAILRAKDMLMDTPAKSIASVLDWIDSDGGLRVDIFKKNQHGGLREIYVLDIRSRVLQLCLEEVSRALCLEFPMEMMMHPENKIKRPQEHMFNTARNPSKYKANISSSNDAKVWNQGHHVVKFAQFLCRLLPKYWHGLIVNGLKQWLGKRIALPDGVLNFLQKCPSTQLYDPIHRVIRDAYTGLEKVPWLKEKSQYLSIETGMMQGILHYTSSLFHTGLLTMRDALWRTFCKFKGINSKTLDLVSSDDSSRMTDIYSENQSTFKTSKILAKADHICITKLSPFFGIFMSSKSTKCCSGVMEFNSEFFFRASLYRPTLKWSYAALNILEVESLVERQEVMYNLITELLEGGSGFRQAHETQLSQSILHYRLMGYSLNPLFPSYTVCLNAIPDPALGFFLLDNPLSTGLAGFSYCLWMATSHNRNLSRLYSGLLREGNLTTTTTGQITRGCQIRFGNRQRALKVVKECETLRPDWREEVELKPEVLYRVARDLDSSFLKMLVKLTSPSVMRTLAKGNSIARMLASSVYLINGLSTTLGSNWNSMMKEINNEDIKKVSLWRLLQVDLSGQDCLSEDQKDTLFPMREYYSTLQNTLERVKDLRLSHEGSRKMLRSHVMVFPEPAKLPFTLEEMVRFKWFGEYLPASSSVLNLIWDKYTQQYKWLSSTPEATLKDSNGYFESHIQLRNFIARQTTRSRVVHLTGAPVRDQDTNDMVLNTIIKNQIPGYTLVQPSRFRESRSIQGDVLMSTLASLLEFPFENKFLVEHVVKNLQDSELLWDGGISRPSNRKVRLALIQMYAKATRDGRMSELDSVNLNSAIKTSRLGVMGGFTRVQKQTAARDGQWVGTGKWSGIIGDASVDITVKDDELVRIETNSISKLRESQLLLAELLKDFGIISVSNTSIQFSSAGVFFDLKQIRADFTGAPITENVNMQHSGQINARYIKLRCDNSSIRLVYSFKPGSYFTLVSYRPNPGDFKYIKTANTTSSILNCWLNNRSLSADSALFILSRRPPSFINEELWNGFVRDSLMNSLVRKGWRFNVKLNLAPEDIAEEDLSYEIDIMGEDFSDFHDFQDDMIETIVEATELTDEVDLEYEVFDLVMGEVQLEQSVRNLSSIRKVHKMWDNLASQLYDEHSSKSRQRMENFKSVSDMRLPNILHHYYGFNFSQSSPEKVLRNQSELESVMEEWQ